MGRYGKWVRYMHNCGRPQYSPGLPGRLDHRAARGDRGWRPQHWKLRNVPRNLRAVMMLVSSVGPTVLPEKSSEQPDPRIPCPQRDFNWNETRHSSVQGKDPANFQQLSWGTRKPRRHKPRAHSTSLEKIGEPGFRKREVHVTAASGSHLAEKRPATAVNTHTLVGCGNVKAPDEGAATTAIESFRVDKQYLPEPTEDCAMRDDYTGPAKPQTQEHCSDISRTCPSLVDEIIKDMDKAYPKISGCYVSGSSYCPHRNQVNEMPKSPAKCPLEDNQSLSKSANIDCAPVNSQRFRNALLQNFRDSSDTAKSVRSLAGNIDSSGSNASLDIVSLVDTVFVISKDAIGTTDEGHAGQGGVLCQLLDEYVKNIEGFLMSLSECAPSYRDKLVSALLPHGIVGLKTIIQLVWKMEAELQFLGRDRVSDLDKGIFSLLMEQADSLSKTTTEQDLPAFMTIEACIEPQLPTLADPPGEPVADDEQRTNCNDVLEHRTKSNPAADVTSEAVGQLGRAEASPVSVASSVDFCATENSDDDEIIIVDDADHEGLMTDALAASPQGTLTGVQRNRIQRLGSISGLRQPSKTVSGKDEIASQPKSLQAGTVDVAVQGTAHTAAAVDVPPVEQEQLSMGITCPPHAATGIVQNLVFDKPLTGKPKNLDAASSAKVSRVVNAKEAPRVPTDTAVAVAATQINSSDKYRLPFTEKAVECRQQRWDQGPKMAPSVNQHSVLDAGMELDLSMQGRQQPDRSALRSPLGCRSRGNVSDTCSTAQHSTQAPKRKVAKVSSQQAILQGVLSSQSSRQGQLAYSAAGKPQQGRQVNVELKDPSQLISTGPQHTGQNEMASVQQSVMSSRQREELAKQIAWMSANAHTFPRNLQGSAGPPYSTAEQYHVPPGWVRRTVLSGDASRPAHAQSFSPQSDLLQGSSNAHTQLQEREPCLLQQHERGQQYAANTNASSFLPSPSASYGFRAVPMDTALIEVEKEVLDRLQMQSYLDQIVNKVKAGKAAPVQQPGHSEALKQRQLSQRELLLRQQINNALHAFAISAPQKAQQWHFRACQSYQRPLQDSTVELSCDSSAQARVDRNNSSAGIFEESTSSESPVGFVRPWTAQSKQPKPYSACQNTLQRWNNRQLDGAPKSGLPENAAEQSLDEYRVDAKAHPWQTTEAQNHVFMHQVFLPEPKRNTAHRDISNHTPVPHTSVSGRKRNIGARSKVSSSALVQQVSAPQQSPNSMAGSGIPGRTYRERSTSTWHPPTSIHDPPA
ncbi:uncharacterized protein LOC142802989 [Rhipicephalus microplus]|uniref:uncharacterized protein LOC142802989 n=1 Tax=Rhipicephalus microplus TaxID=6941 RepID=UPI003F6C09E2